MQIVPLNSVIGFHHVHLQSKIRPLSLLFPDSVKTLVGNQGIICYKSAWNESTLVVRDNLRQMDFQSISKQPL